jgi:hypothetical protein
MTGREEYIPSAGPGVGIGGIERGGVLLLGSSVLSLDAHEGIGHLADHGADTMPHQSGVDFGAPPLGTAGATLNVVGSVDRLQGMVSELYADDTDQGRRLLQAVHRSLRDRGISDVFAVVDEKDRVSAEIFQQAEYTRDADSVVMQRDTGKPIPERKLDTSRRLRLHDLQVVEGQAPVAVSGYWHTLNPLEELASTIPITASRQDGYIDKGFYHAEALVLSTLVQLTTGHELVFAADGHPEIVRGAVFALDVRSRQNNLGATSLKTVVSANDGLRHSYARLGFLTRNASVFRRML